MNCGGYDEEEFEPELAISTVVGVGDANRLLVERRSDERLMTEVIRFLGEAGLPPNLRDGPKFWLARAAVTPNYEFARFVELAAKVGLPASVTSYVEDQYASSNLDKRALVKCVVRVGQSKRGSVRLETCNVGHEAWNGARLGTLRTVSGEVLVNFHARLFKACYGDTVSVCDITPWLKAVCGGYASAAVYYEKYLACTIAHSVLAEVFLGSKEERQLIERTVMPAVKRLKKLFGVEPIIVNHLPYETAGHQMWRQYPPELKEEFQKAAMPEEKRPESQPPAYVFAGAGNGTHQVSASAPHPSAEGSAPATRDSNGG